MECGSQACQVDHLIYAASAGRTQTSIPGSALAFDRRDIVLALQIEPELRVPR
jgi:hypothetical protein